MGRPNKKDKKPLITQQEVIDEMACIAFSSFSDFAEVVEIEQEDGGVCTQLRPIPTAQIPPEKRCALASIKQSSTGVEIKLLDKWRALEALGRILGLPKTESDEDTKAVNIIDDI